MKEKALIKKTGEILDVENLFVYSSITMTIDFKEKLVEELGSIKIDNSIKCTKENTEVFSFCDEFGNYFTNNFKKV